MLCLDVLAPHFHGETQIPKCTSSGDPLKKMGVYGPPTPTYLTACDYSRDRITIVWPLS